MGGSYNPLTQDLWSVSSRNRRYHYTHCGIDLFGKDLIRYPLVEDGLIRAEYAMPKLHGVGGKRRQPRNQRSLSVPR
jgi:hypothetical protein